MPKIVLSDNEPLLGRQPVPAYRLGIVLQNPVAGVVHDPEGGLRRSLSLIRRQSIPAYRFSTVLRDAFAKVVIGPEVELRLGVSLIRRNRSWRSRADRGFGVRCSRCTDLRFARVVALSLLPASGRLHMWQFNVGAGGRLRFWGRLQKT